MKKLLFACVLVLLFCTACHEHTPVTDAAVEATCATVGLTAGEHCSDCGEILVAQTELAKLPHTPVADEAVEATCATVGLTAGEHCSVCNEILVAQTELPKLSHTPVADEAVEATCATVGLTAGEHCSVCGEILVAQTELPKLPHTPVADEAVEATCANVGLTAGEHCSVCNEILVAQTEIPMTDHVVVQVAEVAPTCISLGKTAWSYCKVCEETLTEFKVLDRAPHTVVKLPAEEATCLQMGKTAGEKCSDCGGFLNAPRRTPRADHKFVDGTCTVCGTAEPVKTPVKEETVEETVVEAPVEEEVAEVSAVELVEGDTDFPIDSLTLDALLAKNYNVLKFLKATDGDTIPHTRGVPDYSYVLNPDETLYEGKIKAFGKTCAVYVSANAHFISHVAILADAGYLTINDMPFTEKAKDKQVNNTMAIVNSMFDALGTTGKMTYQQLAMGEGWKTFDGHIDDLPQMIRAEYEGDGFAVHFDGNFKSHGANHSFTISVSYTQYGTFAVKHGHEVLLSVS